MNRRDFLGGAAAIVGGLTVLRIGIDAPKPDGRGIPHADKSPDVWNERRPVTRFDLAGGGWSWQISVEGNPPARQALMDGFDSEATWTFDDGECVRRGVRVMGYTVEFSS